MEQPRHGGAVLRVLPVQGGQQQNIADVEQVHIQLVPVNVCLVILGIGSGVLEEGSLLRLVVAHNRRKGGPARAANHGQVNILVLAELLHDQFPLEVIAHGAGRHQMERRVQPGQVHHRIADRAAGGMADALGDMGQLTLPGPRLNGIGDVHQNVSRAADALLHIHSPFPAESLATAPPFINQF